MNHWTKELPEGRRIFQDEVALIKKIKLKINRLELELKNEKKLLQFEEDSIFENARRQYSIEEITQAKEDFNKIVIPK